MSTKVSSISFPTHSYGRNWLDGYSPAPSYSVATRVATATRNRTGTALPKWRTIIAKGENATTNLTGTWDTIEYTPMPPSKLQWKRQDGQYASYTKTMEIYGDVILTNNVQNWSPKDPQVDVTKCANLARTRFYKLVSARRTQMQGLVFLGEMRETLRMLRRPAAGLQDAIRTYLDRVKKHKQGNPMSWVRNLGDLYLENAFGWQPFINDIKGAGKAWNSLLNRHRERRYQVSAGAALSYDLTSSLTGFQRPGAVYQYVSGPYLRTVRGIFREQHKVRYKGMIQSQVEAPMWASGLDSFGLTIGQFIPAAWELLPWSFLADYFANIGNLLDATVTDMSGLLWVNVSMIRKSELFGTLEIDPENTEKADPLWQKRISISRNQSTCTLKRKLVSRFANSGMSMPNFQFEFSLSDGQLGNIAGLLGSAAGISPQRPTNWHK